MILIAKTFHGLEEVLARELKALGASNIEMLQRAVQFEGDKELLYRANLLSRTALRILLPIHDFKAKHEDRFYKSVQDIYWPDIFGVKDTFAVDSVVHSTYFRHSHYLALKTKDAIVDQFRNRLGRRPRIDTNNPTVRIHLHVRNEQCTLALDSSGDSLHKRGYRVDQLEAPINEVLAAGLIQLSRWQKDCPFVDPMCGSGTILIEGAMYATNIPAQSNRTHFGFHHWKDFDRVLWSKILLEANEKINSFEYPVLGFDKSFQAVRVAQRNVEAAGLQATIAVERKGFEKLKTPATEGIIITNPPYDERLKDSNINDLYKMIGDILKKNFAGFEAWIISSNKEAVKNIGLKTSKKITIFNGPLECKFLKYELYKGSRKNSEL